MKPTALLVVLSLALFCQLSLASIKCPFCGFENVDGALFCQQCKSDVSHFMNRLAVPASLIPMFGDCLSHQLQLGQAPDADSAQVQCRKIMHLGPMAPLDAIAVPK